MKEKQIKEALTRMTTLRITSPCITAFRNGEVWESEGFGALYELNDKEKQIIKEFNEEHPNYLVYHMIHNKFDFGECYLILFVSDEEQEWVQDRDDIDNNCAFAYVRNIDYDDCSEFGTIGIIPSYGGIKRYS